MMKYIDNPNFLTPMIPTQKRHEYICADFYDFIKCESEGTFYKLLKLYETNDPILEGVSTERLEDLSLNLSRDAVFDLCAMYLPLHLVAFMLPDADIDKIKEVYEKTKEMWNSPLYYHRTRYCAILKTFTRNNSIAKIYIVKEKFDEDDLRYLRDTFGESCNEKISAIEGTYVDALNDHKEISFIMARDDRLLVDIIKNGDTDKLEDKCFLISATSCNIDRSEEGLIEFKNKELFNNADNVYVYTTFLYPIKEDKEDSVG